MSVLTFLFTDIEGSTRRWEADPDAMRVALETHNQTLREAVAANDGEVFNYTGDGMCAVFASPRSAVDAAVAAQRSLELPVRMGIATGEAELREGDYFGTVLNRTARVMAAGHGGQILLDGATAALITGVDLISLGPRRLRDISKPVDVFQVQAEGLRTDFPPLKTLDAVPGNLRPQVTSFIGRRQELADLETELKAHRMVTLTGVGGVGKTRLALEVAARSAHDFPDGVWVIELAAVADPAAVPEAVAAALGIVQQPGLNLAHSIAAALESRSRLLVLDNCEHVLDTAADLVEAIFAASSTVKVIATSREGLRVADEQLWPVPSLDVDTSAVDLFVERAHGVAPAASVNDDVGAVVEICRRLDGIPLAIELAASRMQSMTTIEVRDRLDDRFRLLVGSRRGLERHQTLRHAVQWSYDLLDDNEKSLLNRCSVFAGGFDLAGAQAVTNSADEFATLDLLDALVRKSLLVASRSSGQTRFSMLETIRQFAEDQLVQSGAADDVRTTHARHFAGREGDVMALWDSPRQAEAYAWLNNELANLRAAFRWASDHDDLDAAAAIAIYATFLGVYVDQREPTGWSEELIAPARDVDHRRLVELYILAAQCYASGRFDDFLQYAAAVETCITRGHYTEVPDKFESQLGAAYLSAVGPTGCLDWCRKAISRTSGPHLFIRQVLVFALTLTGPVDAALAEAESLLAAAESVDSPSVLAGSLFAYGFAYRDVDASTADEAFRRGLTVAQKTGNRQIECGIANSLARLSAAQDNFSDALYFLTLAIRYYYDSGSFTLMLAPLAGLTILFDRIGRYESAATISEFAARTLLARIGFPEVNAAITHLREVLGDERYASLADAGTKMSNAAMANYAIEQIDQVRAELAHAGGSA
jgi:predicted ATPase